MMEEDDIQFNYYPISLEIIQSSSEPQTNSTNTAPSGSNIAPAGDGSIINGGTLRSGNFVAGSSGWRLDSNGNLEANDGNFRGDITGATGTFSGSLTGGSLNIPDTTTADSFHVNSSGDTWWGGALIANAQAKVLKTGVATFASIAINGGTINGVSVSQVAYVTDPTLNIVPTSLTVSSTSAVVASDGSVSSQVVLTWVAISTDTFDHYQIRYKKTANTYYTYIDAKTNTITIEGLVPNISYDFGIAAVNKSGNSSAFSTDVAQVTATSTTAPATVATVSATGGIQYSLITWDSSASTDLASYNIYRHTANDSAAATLIGNCRTNYFVDGNRTGGTLLYYWIKAVNTSGLVSTSFSTVTSCTPRNVGDSDVVSIGAGKVLIDGVVYLSNWQKVGDVTKIDGGAISANSITTTQLNFTPITGANIIASINSSAEGITIDADNLTISAATTFASGYNPTDKVAEVGGTYDTAASGARVRIFPDANTGIQAIDDATNDVFKVIVGGTDVGDVIMGKESIGQYAKWDKSVGEFVVNDSSITNQDVYGDGSDGDVTISANTTLTEDKYYNNLTINNGYTLDTGGYRVFIKNILTNNGTISRTGNNGGDGIDAVGTSGTGGGTAGAALSSGSISGGIAGIVGVGGGDGMVSSVGSVGATAGAGLNVVKGFGSNGASGSSGGEGGDNWTGVFQGYSGGGGGGGGTKTGTVYNKPRSSIFAVRLTDDLPTFDNIRGSAGSSTGGGGGGGARGGASANAGRGGGGGGSGGSGSTGGILVLAVRKLINNGSINVNGGVGGKGGNGANGSDSGLPGYGGGGGGGGGAGGTGGTGGLLILIYGSKSGSGTITAAGGAGGAGGTGGLGGSDGAYPAQDGLPGTDGGTLDGADGVVIQLQV